MISNFQKFNNIGANALSLKGPSDFHKPAIYFLINKDQSGLQQVFQGNFKLRPGSISVENIYRGSEQSFSLAIMPNLKSLNVELMIHPLQNGGITFAIEGSLPNTKSKAKFEYLSSINLPRLIFYPNVGSPGFFNVTGQFLFESMSVFPQLSLKADFFDDLFSIELNREKSISCLSLFYHLGNIYKISDITLGISAKRGYNPQKSGGSRLLSMASIGCAKVSIIYTEEADKMSTEYKLSLPYGKNDFAVRLGILSESLALKVGYRRDFKKWDSSLFFTVDNQKEVKTRFLFKPTPKSPIVSMFFKPASELKDFNFGIDFTVNEF